MFQGKHLGVRLLLLCWVAGLGGLKSPPAARAATSGAAETAGEPREPWFTSRIHGSPEPASPYRTEAAFPHLRFHHPIELLAMPGQERFVAVEVEGKIYTFPIKASARHKTLAIDLKKAIPGLSQVYGFAFDPAFGENRHVYVCYVVPREGDKGTHVSRFEVTDLAKFQLDVASEKQVITWRAGGHNGGCLRFGPADGYLYISTGDGAGPNPPDTLRTGQDCSDLLSSILRINVRMAEEGKGYRVPEDNPFVKLGGVRPEIWAYGFRNPWRMSFDPETNNLWVGDVGWELWELVYRVRRGQNYGWSIKEGKQTILADQDHGPAPISPPIIEHPHSEAASITGGYVYHGDRLAELKGAYIYGDYATGKIWGLRNRGDKVTWTEALTDTPWNIVCFGVDHGGELFIVDYGGGIYRLVENPGISANEAFPTRLSETGLFASVPDQEPQIGVLPYRILLEPWEDYASSVRFVGVPGQGRIRPGKPWRYPKDTVFVKTRGLEMVRGDPSTRRWIETQVLHFNGEAWAAYSYRWNREQTEARLVGKDGAEIVIEVKDPAARGTVQRQLWRFSSRADCLRCHNPWSGGALGFNALELARDLDGTASGEDQLSTLTKVGLFEHPPVRPRKTLCRPDDRHRDLEHRARSYLHVNCAHCHRENAGGTVNSQMNLERPLDKTSLVGAKPMRGGFGLTDPEVIAAGDVGRSVLFYRMATAGSGHMPHLGARLVDPAGLALIGRWIVELGNRSPNRTSHSGFRPVRLGTNVSGVPGNGDRDLTGALKNPSSALEAVFELSAGQLPSGFARELIEKGARHPQSLVRDLFDRFLAPEEQKKTLARGKSLDARVVLACKGNATRGRRIFFDQARQCATCHRVHGEGRVFGPDLSRVGTRYARDQLLEQVLEPSRFILPENRGYLIETSEGNAYTGLIVSETESETRLRIATGEVLRIPKAEIVKRRPQTVSLMPEGLLAGLSPQEIADLVDFLASLR